MKSADAIILGAGLAGLSAADELGLCGARAIVLEKEDQPGGMCRSVRRNGYTFDFGGHRLLAHNAETERYVRGFFGAGELPARERSSVIRLRERFLRYPPEALDLLRNLGPWTSLACAFQGAVSRIRQKLSPQPEETLEDWMKHRFGSGLYEIYFGPYSAKLWGREPARISADWAPQRISVSSFSRAFNHLFKRCRGGKVATYAARFQYPVGGIGELPSRIAARVRENGGAIECAANVTGVECNGTRFVATALHAGDRIETYSAPSLIVTMPLPEFAALLRPSPPDAVLSSASGLKFRSVRFLNLLLDVPDPIGHTWMYVPESRYLFFRIQSYTRWCPGNAPAGKSAVQLEIACDAGDTVWEMEESLLADRCLSDMAAMGLDVRSSVNGFFTTAARHAYPVYTLDYRRNVATIVEYGERLPGLIFCGRQGLFRYLNMDRALEHGRQAARAALGSGGGTSSSSENESGAYIESDVRIISAD